MLVDGIEALNLFCDPLNRLLAGLVPVLAQAVDQAFFSEFSAIAVVGLGNSIRVQREQISGFQLAIRDVAFPFSEQAKQGAGGIETVVGVVGAQQQAREVSAIGITQPPRPIVVFSEEQRCIGAVDCVLVKQ